VLGQVLDGFLVTTSAGRVTLEAVAGVTPIRTVDFDPSRPNFDHNTRRGLFGGMLSVGLGDHRPFAYALYQKDWNDDDDLTIGLIETDYEYDSAYLGVGSAGAIGDRVRYGVEFAYEFGNSLSNSFEVAPGGALNPVDQTEDTISAWALNAKIDYLAPDVRQTRLSGEFTVASGDDDRGVTNATFNGNRPGTDRQGLQRLRPAQHRPGVRPRGVEHHRRPRRRRDVPAADHGIFRRMQVGVDVFAFAKYDDDAPIDEPTGDDRYLGWEPTSTSTGSSPATSRSRCGTACSSRTTTTSRTTTAASSSSPG
jgi:hypothetical protein